MSVCTPDICVCTHVSMQRPEAVMDVFPNCSLLFFETDSLSESGVHALVKLTGQ